MPRIKSKSKVRRKLSKSRCSKKNKKRTRKNKYSKRKYTRKIKYGGADDLTLKLENKLFNEILKENNIRSVDNLIKKFKKQNKEFTGVVDDSGGQYNTYTALHIACENEKLEIVNLLLKNITDEQKKIKYLNKQNNKNNTALHIACENETFEIVKALLNVFPEDKEDEKKDYINKKNGEGETSLHKSVIKISGKTDIVTYLLKNNADIFAINNEHQTALHIACELKQNSEIVNILLNYNRGLKSEEPDIHYVNRTDKDGNTALHIACEIRNAEVVDSLLSVFTDLQEKKNYLDIQNSQGNTALHIASYNNYAEIYKKLIINGANHAITNNEGKPPQLIGTFVSGILNLNRTV